MDIEATGTSPALGTSGVSPTSSNGGSVTASTAQAVHSNVSGLADLERPRVMSPHVFPQFGPTLPEDMIARIADFATPADRLTVGATCKTLHARLSYRRASDMLTTRAERVVNAKEARDLIDPPEGDVEYARIQTLLNDHLKEAPLAALAYRIPMLWGGGVTVEVYEMVEKEIYKLELPARVRPLTALITVSRGQVYRSELANEACFDRLLTAAVECGPQHSGQPLGAIATAIGLLRSYVQNSYLVSLLERLLDEAIKLPSGAARNVLCALSRSLGDLPLRNIPSGVSGILSAASYLQNEDRAHLLDVISSSIVPRLRGSDQLTAFREFAREIGALPEEFRATPLKTLGERTVEFPRETADELLEQAREGRAIPS
jgi:hypothetical protein